MRYKVGLSNMMNAIEISRKYSRILYSAFAVSSSKPDSGLVKSLNEMIEQLTTYRDRVVKVLSQQKEGK